MIYSDKFTHIMITEDKVITLCIYNDEILSRIWTMDQNIYGTMIPTTYFEENVIYVTTEQLELLKML